MTQNVLNGSALFVSYDDRRWKVGAMAIAALSNRDGRSAKEVISRPWERVMLNSAPNGPPRARLN